MARIKKEVTEEAVDSPVTEQENTQETVDSPAEGKIEDPVLDKAVKDTLKEIEETVQDSPVIPVAPGDDTPAKEKPEDKFIDSILQSFPNYETLYVSARGGVYTPDTKPEIRGAAILYKNPYFNNLKQN
uniref:Uncharacterized protein n=1 Tax=virus sp. ctuZj11 TaxID=2825825 RepID=A0A8S5RAQ0_9VIRU|nr:MAG TPA: hypothetical protein [virus sp. ctuZj11]